MRAVRLVRQGAELEEQLVADPLPGPGEVLVEVRCAGICHSDAHYRADASRVRLPLTLGHEIAGVVAETGPGVDALAPGDRVALHYLLPGGAMLGKERDGGWAERIVVPAGNAVPVPAAVPLEQAAIMMCSTATALHALRLAELRPGESVAILGFGGLGISALRLARALGAGTVLAVDRVPEKLRLAESLGAVPATAAELRDVDVALDFTGHAPTALAGLRGLRHGGRLVLVAIDLRELAFDGYADLLVHERRILGSADHTREELVELLELARRGDLDLSGAISRRVPLAAAAVGAVLDELERGSAHLRTVIRVAPGD
jgi:propanol-preferring alcohol dehydrogenase